MVIPPSRGINQSIIRINTNEDQPPRNQMMNTMIFTEVHLLAGKLLLVVAIHSLGGSRVNRHRMPNLQSGVAQPTQDEDSQATSNPQEYLLALHRGKVKNPSQSP